MGSDRLDVEMTADALLDKRSIPATKKLPGKLGVISSPASIASRAPPSAASSLFPAHLRFYVQ